MGAKQLINAKDFKFIQSLVYQETGIVIADHKQEMIHRRLSRRVKELNLGEVKDYCSLLKQGDSGEMINFVNAVTTNLTSFFRENHHFDYLTQEFFPAFIASKEKHLRIWSSASSTGEEPYSIAISMMDSMGEKLKSLDAKILATDLDTQVLAAAKSGIYDEKRLKDLPLSVKSKWFSAQNGGGRYVADERLRKLITFNKLNLLGSWPMKGKFDVIFCRNVLIYFDKPTQEKLIKRFQNVLKTNGLLMLGHSESVLKGNKDFESLGKTMYRKLVD